MEAPQRIVRKFARECAIPVPKLWHIANDLVFHMKAGLAIPNNLIMLPSYVHPLPTEIVLWLNLRGENFSMLRARLGGKTEPLSDLHREEVSIPSHLMPSTSSKKLFEYVALQLAKFFSSVDIEGTKDAQATTNNLGVTISYQVDQAAASAIKWNSFSADDTVDDTTGDLGGGRYHNNESVAAITLGMATNAAYTEPPQEVPKWHGPSPESGEMVISIEWGNFRSSHLPITEFDTSLDVKSSNPCSGYALGTYLGEIVRRVLLKMAQEAALFGDSVPRKLTTPYLLSHEVVLVKMHMAAMHQDTSEDYEVVDEKLKEIFVITNSAPMVREVVAEVCDTVAERGARLAGAGIVRIIKKLGRVSNKKSVVTVEGGLYEHYRVFRNYLHSNVWEMLGNFLSEHVIFEPSHGGSGVGAIFLAASQSHNPDSS